MEYYNNLLQNIETSNDSDIPLCNIIPKPKKEQNNIMDEIIQHPFIEKTNINLDILSMCREKIYLILYRINEYKGNYVVEFYIHKEMPFIQIFKMNDDIPSKINDTLNYILGSKRITGNINYHNTNYIFIQVRKNNDTKNWLTIIDIIDNNHYYGEKIDENIVDFFMENMELSTLKFKRKYCIKPKILYCNINDEYVQYIRKNISIQYCQREISPLIKLKLYNNNDNIRVLCFIKDYEYSNNMNDLCNNDYIMINDKDPTWIFKNEKYIFPYLK